MKSIFKKLLFPHIALLLVLAPTATVFLVYSMVFMGTETLAAYLSYALAAYTLTIWCVRVPQIAAFCKSFKANNKYARIWLEDPRLRMNVTLYGSLLWNTGYGLLQLGLGFYHYSYWFGSLALYYITMAVMRFFLVRYTRKNLPGAHMREELVKYRTCGIVFLVMNLALSLMTFFMVYRNRTFKHHEITTIAMAAYTFTSLTMAIINAVKYRKYNSPVFSASKAISLASACVPMLTLESTMLTTFGGTMDLLTRRIFLGASGAAVSAVVVAMAVYMIVQSGKKIKLLDRSKEKTNG